MEVPIIKLTVEHMRHSIARCLTEYEDELNSIIRAEVDKLCTYENLTRIIRETVNDEMPRLIKSAVEHSMQHGRIYEEVRSLVNSLLAVS